MICEHAMFIETVSWGKNTAVKRWCEILAFYMWGKSGENMEKGETDDTAGQLFLTRNGPRK